MILFHIFAHKDWDYWTMDEKRAFLSAQRQDTRKMYVTIPGSSKMYEVYNALYGTKDAMRDYRVKVEDVHQSASVSEVTIMFMYIHQENSR